MPANLVARQIKCVYGTPDAGMIWEDYYHSALEDVGFVSSIASPCCFHRLTRGLSVVVHGDDFTCMGLHTDLDVYEAELPKVFEI